MNKKLKLTLLGAIVLGAFFAKDNVKSLAATNAYENGIFYDENKKPANWWYDDGFAWYFFKNGKKLTGEGTDSNGKHQFKNGKYLQGYKNNVFYQDGNPCNWWADDGYAWYFFKDGKKLTGKGTDGNGKRYFVNGKYANGVYNGNLYKDGVDASCNSYVNGIFYDENKKPANWWYDDGNAWYFFKNGKKLTGKGTDSNGKHQFKNGKYLTGYANNLFYEDGDLANWWHDDGNDWYYFKGGKKLTGEGIDANGKRYFINGKYANGIYKGNLYKDGVDITANNYVNGIFYDENKRPANWWYDDGEDWYYFKDGKKLTGEAVDSNGKRYFLNGKYANGKYNGNLYKEGIRFEGRVYINGYFYDENKTLANGWKYDGTNYFLFRNGKKITGFSETSENKKYINNQYEKMKLTDSIIKWFKDREGKVTYSMINRTGKKSYDCSSSLYYAVCYALGIEPKYPTNTESEHKFLLNHGFELVSENENWDRKRGDIFIWGKKGYSLGAGGHTGIFVDKDNIIHCNYSNNGISTNNYEYASIYKPYYYIYRIIKDIYFMRLK